MTNQTLARAHAGDEDAFRQLTDPYRRELQVHVYRIVGSRQDAEARIGCGHSGRVIRASPDSRW